MRTQQAFTRVHSSSFLQGIIRSSLFIRAASLFTTDKEIIDDQTRIMRAPRKGVEPTDLLAVLQEPRLFKQVLMRAEGKFNTQMVTLEEGSKSSEEEGLGSPCPPPFRGPASSPNPSWSPMVLRSTAVPAAQQQVFQAVSPPSSSGENWNGRRKAVGAPRAMRLALSVPSLRAAVSPGISEKLASRVAGNWSSVVYRRCLSSRACRAPMVAMMQLSLFPGLLRGSLSCCPSCPLGFARMSLLNTSPQHMPPMRLWKKERLSVRKLGASVLRACGLIRTRKGLSCT